MPTPVAEGTSLLWRLMAANGVVFALIVLLLAVTPITIDAPISVSQVALLLAGLLAILALDYFLLRWLLRPLQRFTETIRSFDPDRPRRLEPVAGSERELAALASAFGELLERLDAERRESARIALAAQERERLRVARELHDEIGQNLTAITLHAEHSAADARLDPRAELRRVADDIRYTLDEVRRVARELRPEALDDLGLVNALITLCARVADGGPRVERDLGARLPPLDAETELVIYRIAQESLTNVVRHARAENVAVRLTAEDAKVVLIVRDDGIGLPRRLPQDAAGIAGMRERARLVSGTLEVSSDRRGTEVRLEMPIAEGGGP